MQLTLGWKKPQTGSLFLVPNYNKFEREREILQALKQGTGDFASIRAQVYSFHRLAWFYLQQTGWLSKTAITDTGATMILRKNTSRFGRGVDSFSRRNQ